MSTMNRVVSSLCKSYSRLSVGKSFHSFNSTPSSSLIVPNVPPPRNIQSILDNPTTSVNHSSGGNSIYLPALDNARQVYSLPTLNRAPIAAPPPTLHQILERMDPETNKPEIKAPSLIPPVAMHLSPRLLTIRRKKMKKHKRRKRYDRDFFKYQKYHREKKLRAEREYVKRMRGHLAELNAFDPEKYVEKVITEAKKEWQDDLTPAGKPLYPHWSRLMSLEELYGLPKSDYIDKKAGLPTEEDWEQIKKLKQDYENKYRGV